MITPTIFDVKCVRTWVWIKMVRPCNPQIRWYGWFPMSYVLTHIQLTRVVCGPWCWMIFCSSSLGWFPLISSKTHSRIAHINHPRNHGCRHHVFRDTDLTNHNLCFQILGHSWSSHVFPKLGFPLDLRILSSEFPGCQRDPRLWDEWRPVRRGKRGHHGGFMGSTRRTVRIKREGEGGGTLKHIETNKPVIWKSVVFFCRRQNMPVLRILEGHRIPTSILGTSHSASHGFETQDGPRMAWTCRLRKFLWAFKQGTYDSYDTMIFWKVLNHTVGFWYLWKFCCCSNFSDPFQWPLLVSRVGTMKFRPPTLCTTAILNSASQAEEKRQPFAQCRCFLYGIIWYMIGICFVLRFTNMYPRLSIYRYIPAKLAQNVGGVKRCKSAKHNSFSHIFPIEISSNSWRFGISPHLFTGNSGEHQVDTAKVWPHLLRSLWRRPAWGVRFLRDPDVSHVGS